MMYGLKFIGAASALMLVACAQESAPPSPDPASSDDADPAADTTDLPDTDIFLAMLSLGDDRPQLNGLRNVTMAPGYDNQPSFLPDESSFYFVSEGVSGKTDIWRYDIDAGDKSRVYESPGVSEYSPKAAPAGYGLSYIQENETGDVTRVHHSPISGGPGEAVADLEPLGYYTWLGDGAKLGVFLRSDPPLLHLVDIASGETELIEAGIGRSLQATPDGGGLYFTKEGEGGAYQVLYLDLSGKTVAAITALPETAQDYFIVFSENGDAHGMFAGVGSALYFLDMSDEGAAWTKVADYGADGLSNITRIAVSDDAAWIAFVAEPQ
jgi:Tol biopolymer transport system component